MTCDDAYLGVEGLISDAASSQGRCSDERRQVPYITIPRKGSFGAM